MGTTRLSAEGAVTRGLSPAIWQAHGFIGGDLSDPSLISLRFEDLARVGSMTSATNKDGLVTYQDTGVTVGPSANTDNSQGEFGVLVVAGNDADNDEGHIELVGSLVRIDPTAGHRSVVAIEARIKKASVANDALAIAIGLGEPGFAAADGLVDNTGALASKDFVGFQTLHASGSEIDAIYRKAGQTLAQVKDNAATMVADTWIKLGVVYDPNGPQNQKLKFFVDGVELGESVTDAIIAAGTVFPTDEEMVPVFLTKVGAAAESTAQIDWVAVGSIPTGS
jgi:hypothetical protein